MGSVTTEKFDEGKLDEELINVQKKIDELKKQAKKLTDEECKKSELLVKLSEKALKLTNSINEVQERRKKSKMMHYIKENSLRVEKNILNTAITDAKNNMVKEELWNVELEAIKKSVSDLHRHDNSKQDILLSDAKNQLTNVAKFIEDSGVLEPEDGKVILVQLFLKELAEHVQSLEMFQLSDPALSDELNNLVAKVEGIPKWNVYNSEAQLYLEANKRMENEMQEEK